MKEISLTYDESTLLETVIEYNYFRYATPPFKDVEERFSITMDASQDIVKAAERQAECYSQQQKNDLLAELGAKDDPTSPDYISQLQRADFYAARGLTRRWYNGLQYALFNRLRYVGNHEEALKAYLARNDRSGLTITYESLSKDSTQNRLYVENYAIDDLRAMVHYVCDYMGTLTPQSLAAWLESRRQEERGFEDKVSTAESVTLSQEAQDLVARFTTAYEALVVKLLTLYRTAKYKSVL